MVLVFGNVKAANVELVWDLTELNDALRVQTAYHAQIAPDYLPIWGQKNGALHWQRLLRLQKLQHSGVLAEQRLTLCWLCTSLVTEL